jgi:hypothetical protein
MNIRRVRAGCHVVTPFEAFDRGWLREGDAADLDDPFMHRALEGQLYKFESEPAPEGTAPTPLSDVRMIRLRATWERDGTLGTPPASTTAAPAIAGIQKPDARPTKQRPEKVTA